MLKKAVAALALVLALTACSSGVSNEEQSNGQCKQKREKSFLGITYSKREFLVDCDSVG
jgi:uncharacterized lipoprotein